MKWHRIPSHSRTWARNGSRTRSIMRHSQADLQIHDVIAPTQGKFGVTRYIPMLCRRMPAETCDRTFELKHVQTNIAPDQTQAFRKKERFSISHATHRMSGGRPVGDVSPRLAVEEVCRSGKLFDAPVICQVIKVNYHKSDNGAGFPATGLAPIIPTCGWHIVCCSRAEVHLSHAGRLYFGWHWLS
jgi:hypothetical protein